MLRTEYEQKQIEPTEDYPGPWQYINWLPVDDVDSRILEHSSTFHTYRSEKLADHLGLENLVICLNAFRPGQQASMKTATFKDIEAELSFQRVLATRENGKPFVLSSDGNIATAFTYYANMLQYPVVLSVTEEARQHRIWSYWEQNPYVTLLSMKDGCDYYNAIELANQLGQSDHFVVEGGARNVARRDGVGTIVIDATRMLGRMPDHYFQALGSGPGAIAAYEASLRLQRDGRYGDRLPRIHGAQNAPFAPMYDAWHAGTRCIDTKYQCESAKNLIRQVHAHVLTNRHPAYDVKGGVYDALSATNGEFYCISNEEARRAQELFKRLEGCSIVPAAGVTVASLIQAVEHELVDPDDAILLNITGGGRQEMEMKKFKVTPSITLTRDYDPEQVLHEVLKCNKKLSTQKNSYERE
jgi:cysteate synthase